MVAIECDQHSNGIVIRSAQHERRTAFGESHQEVVGIGQSMGICDDGSDVVERDLPKLLAFAIGVADNQKAPMHEQVAPVIRDFDDATYHDGLALEAWVAQLTDGRDGDLARFGLLHRASVF